MVGVVNPTGRMMPYETSGKERSQCRLPAAVALVEHGLVDVLYLPEANVDANGVRAVETYMTSVEDVEVVGAPSSAAVSTMEQMVAGSPLPARVSGGALMLLRAPLARRIQKVAYYCSGRLLHVHLRTTDGRDLHLVGVYGVSAPESSAQKRQLAAELCSTLTSLVQKCGQAATIVPTATRCGGPSCPRVTGASR